jgi:glycerol kinase
MQKDSGERLSELRVDGGAAANDLLMQFQADILGVPVGAPARARDDRARRGLPLPGLATSLWTSREEIASHWEMERMFEPQMNADAAADLLGRWRSAVHRSLRWA